MRKAYDRILGRELLHKHDPLYLISPDGTEWIITVSDGGTLVITGPPPAAHTPMGLLLALTYAS